jgi:hypothetical protein
MTSARVAARRRVVVRGLVLVGVAVLGVATGALGYRAWRQHETAQALAIDPRAVAEDRLTLPVGEHPGAKAA